MSIAAALYNDQVSDISGYAIYADARLGGNGDAWGTPERVVGSDEYNAEWDRVTWDGDLEDGFDTGNIGDALIVTSDVANDSTTANNLISNNSSVFNTTSIGYINTVEFRAFTLAAATVQWSNICIRFYSGDDLVDQYDVTAGPSVDTTHSETTTAESVLNVSTACTTCNRVEIYGTFRMSFDSQNVYPQATDLGAQIFVFAANPS